MQRQAILHGRGRGIKMLLLKRISGHIRRCMHRRRIPFYGVLLLCLCSVSHAWPHKRALKARVHFLAAETLIRGTWGTNQDSYLAEFLPEKNTPSGLLQVMDEYPQWDLPVSRETLTSQSGTKIRLKRDAACDVQYGELNLRAAPGDLIAILPVHLTYQPALSTSVHSSDVIPCYRLVRRWKTYAQN